MNNAIGKMNQHDALHDFRKNVDSVIRYSEVLIRDSDFNKDCGRELALVKTKLQEAKMWAGKALEMTGSQLPEQFRDVANN